MSWMGEPTPPNSMSRGTATYQDIYNLSCKYFSKKYGEAIVVFDGCNRVSTKSMTQHRRAAGKVGSIVTFSANMKVTLKKEEFLSSSRNKQLLINLLSQVLQNNNCITRHADGNADLLIVK